MMTRFCTLASGSGGNAALLSADHTHILIDMGISCRRVIQTLASLGVQGEQLTAILITHEHSDHIAGLATYRKKYRTPIVTTHDTAQQLTRRMNGIAPLLHGASWGETVSLGAVEVTVLPTSHDCIGSCAFLLETAEGSIGYLTDTGYIPASTAAALLGTHLLVLESNHDTAMLQTGPYPYALKQRVLGKRGHLSNDMAAAFAYDSAKAGTQHILLAHLSRENNTPQLALDTVGQRLDAMSYQGTLSCAPYDACSEIFVMETEKCSG